MKNLTMLLLCLLLIGCTTSTSVGSKNWHNLHLDELRDAHLNGHINTEKYLEMKAEADRIRREYVRDRDAYFERNRGHHYYCPRYGYGYGYHSGACLHVH